VEWGLERGPFATKCDTAREALLLAEEHIAAQRAAVTVVNMETSEQVPIETLRELAEEEAGEKKA
jgi:Arc/MetJ-type ribon-helix-helix transcriptional regulator